MRIFFGSRGEEGRNIVNITTDDNKARGKIDRKDGTVLGLIDYKNILVIKMSALGDIIHALPSLYALRELYPAARISWVVEPQFSSILPDKPYIDEKIIFQKNALKKQSFFGKIAYLRQLRAQLRSRNFDLVIDLQGLLKSSLIALLSGCGKRIGYWEMREGSFLVTRPVKGENSDGHVIQRYLDVIRYLGAPGQKIVFPLADFTREKEKMRALLKEAGVSGRFALLFPASRWATKEWPPESYAALSEKFAARGLFTVLAGSADDKIKAAKVKELSSAATLRDFTGKTDLRDLAGLIGCADLCVGGDTGPLHIAAAMGVPVVSLFGPVSGGRTSAFGSTVIATGAPCAPCFKRRCPTGRFVCMALIGADEVFDACAAKLWGVLR